MNVFLNNEISKVGLFYSIFYGSIGITSIFSGLLGDLTNRMKVTKIGMFMLAIAYLLIIFLPNSFPLFFSVLIILGVSIGLTIPNTIVLFGNLFNEQENQTFGLSGFITFSIVINAGVLLSPLLADFLKINTGVSVIFIIAFIFSLISVVFFIFFEKRYYSINLISEQKHNANSDKYKKLHIFILVSIIIITILLKFILGQRTFVFVFYLREYIETGLDFYNNLTKSNSLISIICLIIFSIIVISIKNINWKKIFIFLILGAIIGAFTYSIIAVSGTSKVSNRFAFSLFALLLISETLIYSTTLYIVFRSSPKKLKGLFQGIVFIIANPLLFLGAILYEEASLETTFIIFSVIFFVCACLIFGLIKIVKKKQKEINSWVY